MTRRHLLAIPLFLMLALVGCGGKNPAGNVHGKVTYNGTPVTGGEIAFHTDAGVYTSTITPEGTYGVGGIPPGDAVVTVSTESLNPNVKQQTYTGQGSGPAGMYKGSGGSSPAPAKAKDKAQTTSPMPEGAGGQSANKGTYVKIPARYNDKTKSDLKVKIEEGSREVNLELKD